MTGASCGISSQRSRCHADTPFEIRRLVQLARHALQAGVQQDHAERAAAPDVGDDHRRPARATGDEISGSGPSPICDR